MGEHQSPTLGLPSGMCWLRTSPIHPCGQNWLLCSFVRRPCVKGNKIHGPRYFDRQLFRIILPFHQMDNYFISLNINCFIKLFDGTGSATNWLVPNEKSHILRVRVVCSQIRSSNRWCHLIINYLSSLEIHS